MTRWPDPNEPDPIMDEQVAVLHEILGGPPEPDELEGFLIVCSRLVDEFGNHRTRELANVFRTSTPSGRDVLRESLRYMNRWMGGMAGYESRFPVTIVPPRPAFPLFKIVGIDRLHPQLYRVLDSRAAIDPGGLSVKAYIIRHGRLPAVPRQPLPARRSKPRWHWCSPDTWASPSATQDALQILPQWSNCRLRASIPTRSIRRSAFLAFNGDRVDPGNQRLKFVKYFFEPIAQDHDELSGGGLQIGVVGSPRVTTLEEWSAKARKWKVVWSAPPGGWRAT